MCLCTVHIDYCFSWLQTCLSRIRLDLPVLDEDFGQNENDENVMDSGNQGDDVDDDERIQVCSS